MKHAVYIGAVAGVLAFVIFDFFTMLEATRNQRERNEQAFRAACEAVHGRTVWNNRYWECLK